MGKATLNDIWIQFYSVKSLIWSKFQDFLKMAPYEFVCVNNVIYFFFFNKWINFNRISPKVELKTSALKYVIDMAENFDMYLFSKMILRRIDAGLVVCAERSASSRAARLNTIGEWQ